MATPHQGSDAANTALTLSKILRITSFGAAIRNQCIEDLKKDCDKLLDLSEGFRHQTIQIVSFFETRPTTVLGVSTIVSRRYP